MEGWEGVGEPKERVIPGEMEILFKSKLMSLHSSLFFSFISNLDCRREAARGGIPRFCPSVPENSQRRSREQGSRQVIFSCMLNRCIHTRNGLCTPETSLFTPETDLVKPETGSFTLENQNQFI